MDQFVIYYSRADRRWVAHSLRTDQIGTGEQPLTAMVDALKAIRQIIELAQADPTINPWREAPAAVKKMAGRSQPLPAAIGEMALRIANGLWPENLRVAVEPASSAQPFKADLLGAGY